MVLEREPGMDFLGLEVVVRPRAIVGDLLVHGYNELIESDAIKQNRWRYRGPAAAGSLSRQFSGVKARLHIAARLPFPLPNAKKAVVKLLAMFVRLGFSKGELQRIVHSHSRKYPQVYCKVIRAQIGGALGCPNQNETIMMLREAVGHWAREM